MKFFSLIHYFYSCCIALGLLSASSLVMADSPSYYATISNILSYSNLSKQANICVFNDVGATKGLNQYFSQSRLSYQAVSVDANSFKNTSCQAVYFSNLSPTAENEYINRYARPLLSFSSSNAQCEIGSAFCLYRQQHRISVAINLDSLSRSKVNIDPRVLKWASGK